MAKGKKWVYCKTTIYTQSEKNEAKGSWVVYICRNGNCNHTEKVFESN